MKPGLALLVLSPCLVPALARALPPQGLARGGPTLLRPPRVTTSLPDGATVSTFRELRFTVTVQDPDGDPVTLRMLNVPAGLTFQPLEAAPSPATVEVVWHVPVWMGGVQNLSFTAWDDPSNRPVRHDVRVRVIARSEPIGLVTGDVTGDGVPDVLGAAPRADAVAPDAGALYVWSGPAEATNPPLATLTVPGAQADDRLSTPLYPFDSVAGQGLQLADVTGDGVLDVIATTSGADGSGTNRGAVYVWHGGKGLAGDLPPTATLAITGVDEDHFGFGSGQGVQFADVTGDGVQDVVVTASYADLGFVDRGTLAVFAGGPGLVGTVPRTALLLSSSPANWDTIGQVGGDEQGVQLADVTGDGIADVVVGAPSAELGPAKTGLIFLWAGGSPMSGFPGPTAVLEVPSATENAGLGHRFRLVDVTGDSLRDVVAFVYGDYGGVENAGTIHVWRGGSGLSGIAAPSATLFVPDASPGDVLGYTSTWDNFVDLTADGVLDVVAVTPYADSAGAANTGAVYIWEGGASLDGTVEPQATLRVPGALASDRLGELGGDGAGAFFADLTGDGLVDVLVGSSYAGPDGALYLWAGGALAGSPPPYATLAPPPTGGSSELADSEGHALLVADVHGDGNLDVVAGSPRADGGGTDVGAIHVWAGPLLPVSTLPSATLRVFGAPDGDRLGSVTNQGIHLGDVGGDGVLDVVAGSQSGLYAWAGGLGLMGELDASARLVYGPGVDNGLDGLSLADVTGDGVLDLIATDSEADLGAMIDVGVAWVWHGGSGLSGVVPPSAELSSPEANGLTRPNGIGLVLADVDGDRRLDIVTAAPRADAPVWCQGAIYVWRGGAALSGTAVPRRLSVTGASPGDFLTAYF